jgi:hypothetical protein
MNKKQTPKNIAEIKSGKKELSKIAHSNKYLSYFNNKKYSDIKIRFSESNNILFCHKVVLIQSFVLGEMINNVENEIIIDKEEDEKSFTNFIQFLYTGYI